MQFIAKDGTIELKGDYIERDAVIVVVVGRLVRCCISLSFDERTTHTVAPKTCKTA